jgi:hypothetical protein
MPAATASVRPASGGYPEISGAMPPASASQSIRPLPSMPPQSLRPGGSGAGYPLPDLPPMPAMVEKPEPTVVRKLLPGAILVLLSIVVTLGDQWYAASSGELLNLGPLRATWIAGVCMLAGVVLLAIRMIPSSRG